ncbi:response regulator transcription factor [Wenxinia marina]|uniref:Response regulator n=1 Tax=Wenxinia marina DSM 24838 TaxID=1123501 RepID=A0A0D0NLN6_9RHOB|nr:response regulator transcription factor [Wenxinia marina]KIQ69185.1 Response regulator [Wenxinia marina DSM 24838]
MKILLVDDDPLIRSVLVEALRHSGYTDVTEVDSAEEAVRTIAGSGLQFDCFLVDLRMPGADGDILCRWLRGLAMYKTTPIIMITAARHEDEISLAFESGASDYLTKPLDLGEFAEKVRRIDGAFPAGEKRSTDRAANGAGPVHFEPARMLGGVPREIDFVSMENYLRRISASNAADVELFAVAIRDAARLNFVCSSTEYADLLRQVAHAVARQVGPDDCFIAHKGDGTLVCVSRRHDRPKLQWRGVESAIQRQVENVSVPSSGSDSIGLSIQMSEPQDVSSRTGEQAVEAMRRAAADAERSDRPVASPAG